MKMGMIFSKVRNVAVLLLLSFFCFLPHVNAATADSFRYPVGAADGTGWIGNTNGIQWLQQWNYGGTCGSVYHPAIDFNKDGTSGNGDLGEPVYAVANGVVTFSGSAGATWGEVMLIEHTLSDGSKVWSQYGHVRSRLFSTGAAVSKGQQIAQVGNANGAWYAHLHFEVRKVSMTAGAFPCGQSRAYVEARYYEPQAFIRTRMSPPPTVTLQTPANNATAVTPTNLAFSWTSRNATAHRLVISTNSDFSGFVDADGNSRCSNASTCWTTTTGSATSSTWSLSVGTTYYWKVRASGAGGSVWTSYQRFTTSAKPSAPTGLTASASGKSITLRWTDASSNESGFRVARYNGSAWASLYTTGAGATSYTDSGLSSNTTYYYKVCSYNSAGESCPNYVYATTGTSGSVPGGVSVNPSSGSWTANQSLVVTGSGATTIYYTMVNTYDGSTPSDPYSPSASNNNGYLSGSSANFSLYGSSGQIKKTNLRFRGCNSYGCGPVSGVYSYAIDQRSTITKPAMPGSLSAAAASSSSITIRWSDLSTNESGFRVYRWNGSIWASLITVGTGTTSYTNSGLSANTSYYYTVCSYNSAGESCPSIYVQATTSGISGGSWDGKSPSGTACEQDATTVAYRTNSYGKVELRWSNTCKTNWTRVVPNSSSYSTYGKIRRTSDGRNYTTSGTGSRFTAMVYSPSVQACASGTIKGYTISEVCR